MNTRQITFATSEEAEAFKSFCYMKAVRLANKITEGHTVTIFTVMTDDQWNELIYKFGRWYN